MSKYKQIQLIEKQLKKLKKEEEQQLNKYYKLAKSAECKALMESIRNQKVYAPITENIEYCGTVTLDPFNESFLLPEDWSDHLKFYDMQPAVSTIKLIAKSFKHDDFQEAATILCRNMAQELKSQLKEFDRKLSAIANKHGLDNLELLCNKLAYHYDY